MRKNFNTLDGEVCDNLDGVENYQIATGMTTMRGNPFDADNFYPASGCGCGNCPCSKCQESSSMALGGLIPSRAELQKIRARRQNRKDIRAKSNAVKRTNVSQSKLANAQAQKSAAIALANQKDADIIDVKQKLAEDKGMSLGAKIGIGVGVLAVIGVAVYLIKRKSK